MKVKKKLLKFTISTKAVCEFSLTDPLLRAILNIEKF